MSWSRGKQLEGRKGECTSLEGVLAAPHEGCQRFLASAGLRGDRGCPCPLGSSLIALGQGGEVGMGGVCNAGACSDEMFLQSCGILY